MVLFITTQKNVIYIFVPQRPEFCTYIFTVRKYYRSAYKCFHYFGPAARSFKSTNFWYSAEFIRGTSIVRRGLFFPHRCGKRACAARKSENPPAAAQSVSIKANGFRRYSAFYQEHRICNVRSVGLRASLLSRARKN